MLLPCFFVIVIGIERKKSEIKRNLSDFGIEQVTKYSNKRGFCTKMFYIFHLCQGAFGP